MTAAHRAPLRIGVLGAARIADDGIIGPARLLGHEVVAVAARDRRRAETFAGERHIPVVHDDYAGVLGDPEVDLVYNALVNSEHTRWNLAALAAGKDVLSEKPMATDAAQAREVRSAAVETGRRVMEAFHYLHHPVNRRLRELVESGALGEVERVEIVLTTPPPPATDPRWSTELAGGATMDLGCYVLHAARQVGRWLGGAPRVERAVAARRPDGVDEAMRVSLAYGPGAAGPVAECRWDMSADERVMTWTVAGSRGTATSTAFAVPHLDNRLVVVQDGEERVETLGEETSYTYQLRRVARTLQEGEPFECDLDDAVDNAALIEDCLHAAGRGPTASVTGRGG